MRGETMTERIIINEFSIYSSKQVVAALGISQLTLHQWRDEGLPKSHRGTASHYYRGRDLIAFMFEDVTTQERLVAYVRSLGGEITVVKLKTSRNRHYPTKEAAEAALQILV